MLAIEHIQKIMLRMVYEDYDSSYDNLLAKCHMSTQEVYKAAVNVMTPNYVYVTEYNMLPMVQKTILYLWYSMLQPYMVQYI